MDRTQRINNLLKKNFKEFEIQIQDNSQLHAGHNNFDGLKETHILVVLKINNKEKLNRLNLHRRINTLLENEFNNGLHSLEIKII